MRGGTLASAPAPPGGPRLSGDGERSAAGGAAAQRTVGGDCMAARTSHDERHRTGTPVRLDWLRTAIARNVIGGLLAMTVTYGIGSLVGHATG